MNTAAAISETNSELRHVLTGRRLINRIVHRVDCACRLTPAGFDPVTGEGVVIGCKCGAMENRDPATLLPFPHSPAEYQQATSEGALLAHEARRRLDDLIRSTDCAPVGQC